MCRIALKNKMSCCSVQTKNPSTTATKKIKVRFHKKQSMPSYCTLFWFKTDIAAYEFFDQGENNLCKLKAFHNKHIMLKTYCSVVHAPPFLVFLLRFWENVTRSVSTFGIWLEKVKISGGIISPMCNTRISKTSPFSTSDVKLAKFFLYGPDRP